MSAQRFEAVLEPYRTGTVIEIPFDVAAVFGSLRPPVRGTLNGFPFRSTVMTMGGRPLLGVNREVRQGAGVEAGERVVVELERDEEPRTVEVPSDLAAALAADATVRAAFDDLAYTHRKEYVNWIVEAKREETRRSRVAKAVAMLREGKKHP